MNDQNLNTNMALVTREQLQAVGINKSDEEMDALIAHVTERANQLIGEEIVDSLGDDQLKEFVDMQEKDTDPQVLETWLQECIPEYAEIIEDNIAIVLGELAENAEAL